MKKQLTKLALTATIALAITLTFTACEEKKKQDGTATEPAAATETQEATQEVAASESEPSEEDKCPNAVTGNGTLSCGGQTYKTVKIGEQVWMAENLAYEAKGSKCFENGCYKESDDGEYICNKLSESEIKANCQKYGRLYDWKTATKACPSGWHLPSDNEWQTLANFVGGEKIAGKKLKAKSGWNNYAPCIKSDEGVCEEYGEEETGNGTDDYGFSALPGGLGESTGYFNDVGDYGYWWSATESLSYNAYYRGMGYSYDHVYSSNLNKSDLLSVRCIKD